MSEKGQLLAGDGRWMLGEQLERVGPARDSNGAFTVAVAVLVVVSVPSVPTRFAVGCVGGSVWVVVRVAAIASADRDGTSEEQPDSSKDDTTH